MSSWRDQILKEFTPKVAHLTLVADPDGLLLEEGILEGIRERGFELIPFEDHVAFRYVYETKFRSRWDKGEQTDLPAPRPDIFYVYVIQCGNKSLYIGQTDNLQRRWKQHNKGEVTWTAPRKPIELVHYEEFKTREEAVNREKHLKTTNGRREIKKLIMEGRARQAGLVVALCSGASDLGSLPYDLLQAGRRLSFNLGEIFPNLSYPVIAALDRGDLEALFDAQKQHAPGVLGDNATKEFVLRHVFEIAPELIRKPSDLLRVLLRRHYREQRIPTILDERFIHVLRQNDGFEGWPLDSIIPDREAFFAFLQERWPIFLDLSACNAQAGRSAKKDGLEISEDKEAYGLEFPGPLDLPFDHDDIRIYIDNLFLEGLLQAVSHEQADSLSKTWLAIGIRTDEQADRTRRVNGLLDNIASTIPKEDTRHDDWFHFAKTWAEIMALVLEPDLSAGQAGAGLPEAVHQRIKSLQTKIDAALVTWLKKRYAGLFNLPPVPPVMLHHIPRFLARYIANARGNKVAFILVDGLSLDQWVVIRKALTKQHQRYRFRENAVFAWIPTITSVSRQAAFAGKPPIYYPNSIHTTNKESALWTQFWADQGLSQHEVIYAKGLGDGTLNNVEELITNPMIRVAGLIVDKVDKIMHGMELGAAGMHNQIQQWALQPFMTNLIELLLNNGYRIYLTSDHGNVEAVGCGRPAEGAVADIRGERVRVYSDSILRAQIKNRFPDALEWPPIGLPENYLPLLAPGRSAFVRETERLVAHGGISLEEVVVPLIQIEKGRA